MEGNSSGITVSPFDYSVENHLNAMNTIRKLCEIEEEEHAIDEIEMEEFNSRITFLREWKHYCYMPRDIRFSCEIEGQQAKDVIGEVNLHQFSSANVPKTERWSSDTRFSETSKDFVLYVGGHVWALDWCPSVHQQSDCHIKCEYLAVAAHPPESSYHKIGAPLTGRGLVQIWCVLHTVKEEVLAPISKIQGQKSRKQVSKEKDIRLSKRPRGRPRKESLDDSERENQKIQETAAQLCNTKEETPPPVKKARGRYRKKKDTKESVVDLDTETEPVLALDVNISQALSQSLSLTEATRNTEEHAKISDADVGIDDPNREHQMVQVTSLELCGAREKILLPPKKARGRPKKQKGIEESVPALTLDVTRSREDHVRISDVGINDLNSERQMVQVTSARLCGAREKIPLPPKKARERCRKQTRRKQMDIKELIVEPDTENTEEHAMIKNCNTDASLETLLSSYKMPTRKRKMKSKTKEGYQTDGISPCLLAQDDDRDSFIDGLQGDKGYAQDALTPSLNLLSKESLDVSTRSSDPPKDVALPRVVLCLAHNGKVAWDVKWRPPAVSDVEHKHRMGYLAVLLGNGSLEVWEIPSPRAIEIFFSSCKKEGTDPRFVKVDPVFRCSKLKSGDRHSIPLTVEWSTAFPHDLLLAGCHDGTVALWKFSASGSSQDTRPLLCFSADTLPIRALAWAPDESDEESANMVLTAGHGGVRFWDIRDPYRPLWDVNPVRRFIYGLDWLGDPRCVIMSFDDGTLRVLSLSKSVYDVPATGKPFAGTQQLGLHSHFCSSFPIWSVQASRLTGQVVYCSADGCVHRFQLTRKAVEKDATRNRAPHFLCGSVSEEGTALSVNTPLPNIPILMKKPAVNESGEAPRSIRGVLSDSNDQTPQHQPPLALCYGDDDDPSFHTSKASKTSKKKKGDRENIPKAESDVEVLPPKMIAMHRVRWNMNKGSERWVCYGGAAGIVRCQEISIGDHPLVKK